MMLDTRTVKSLAIINIITALKKHSFMANLTIPNKTKHKYVLGIDFGHGETSAAICELEWDKSAGQRLTEVADIDIDRAARKKVIPSAICRTNGGLYIGDEAFEHTTDNQGIRVCFKQKPSSLDGAPEALMSDYMKAVYNKILENDDRLKPDNHIVYIARPSGWTDEDAKELYRQMAINAGIPLAGLTSESRAAIFYAKSPKVNFANEINRGAIVFDLGSSTLDFTYLSDNDSPIDFGYNLGASKIDGAIYSRLILKSEEVQEFVAKYPEYHDALLYKARKFKEEAYSRNEDSKTSNGFTLEAVISEGDASYEEYCDTYVKLRINNLHELNDIVEEEVKYQANLRDALNDFMENHIKGRKVNGVFLTGGASRMNFIRPLIADVLELPIDKVKIDGDNPSLTISRGIALLGATDAVTAFLVSQLKSNIPSLLNSDRLFKELVSKLSENLADAAWSQVKSTCNRWIRNGNGTDEDQLKAWLEQEIKKFQQTKLRSVVEETVRKFIISQGEVIRKKTNEIISRYAPGREISMNESVGSVDMTSINKSLEEMSKTISDICDSITNTLANVLWAALGIFLFGLFAVGYYIIKGVYNFFRDDSDIRKDKAKKLLDKRDEVISDVKTKMNAELSSNSQFKSSLMNSLTNHFTNLIDKNLQKVIIPIE